MFEAVNFPAIPVAISQEAELQSLQAELQRKANAAEVGWPCGCR